MILNILRKNLSNCLFFSIFFLPVTANRSKRPARIMSANPEKFQSQRRRWPLQQWEGGPADCSANLLLFLIHGLIIPLVWCKSQRLSQLLPDSHFYCVREEPEEEPFSVWVQCPPPTTRLFSVGFVWKCSESEGGFPNIWGSIDHFLVPLFGWYREDVHIILWKINGNALDMNQQHTHTNTLAGITHQVWLWMSRKIWRKLTCDSHKMLFIETYFFFTFLLLWQLCCFI